jgi:hypothetical protein
MLLSIDASEWSIEHRLDVYLESWFSTFNVDCEYKRLEYDTRSGTTSRASGVGFSTWGIGVRSMSPCFSAHFRHRWIERAKPFLVLVDQPLPAIPFGPPERFAVLLPGAAHCGAYGDF